MTTTSLRKPVTMQNQQQQQQQQQEGSRQQPAAAETTPRRRLSPKTSLTLDLSNLPPPPVPTQPTNTLLLTNLTDPAAFSADNQTKLRAAISRTKTPRTWTPLRSFRRVVASFASVADAAAVRAAWDGVVFPPRSDFTADRMRIYFGAETLASPVSDDGAPRYLALPDAGKLFFISPPPSPPRGWEARPEDAPNKTVHAADLAEALAGLSRRHTTPGGLFSPAEEDESAGPAPPRTRSRSSTLIFHPDEHGSSPDLPAINVEDMTDSPAEMDGPSVILTRPPQPTVSRTARPPVELMNDA